MPLDLSLNWSPDWVPAGTLSLALPPSIVGTSMVPPIAASIIDIGTSENKFSSSLINKVCLFNVTKIYKSPCCPPLSPASPSPDSLILEPSSTP